MFLARHRQHRPDVHRFAVAVGSVGPADVLEVRRQHADDTERPARKPDGCADDRRRIAVEAPHPQARGSGSPRRCCPAISSSSSNSRPSAVDEPSSVKNPALTCMPRELFGLLRVAELQIGADVGGEARRTSAARRDSRGNPPAPSGSAAWSAPPRTAAPGDPDPGYGSGATSTPWTALKIAALAPIDSASVRIAAAANPGDRRRSRIA